MAGERLLADRLGWAGGQLAGAPPNWLIWLEWLTSCGRPARVTHHVVCRHLARPKCTIDGWWWPERICGRPASRVAQQQWAARPIEIRGPAGQVGPRPGRPAPPQPPLDDSSDELSMQIRARRAPICYANSVQLYLNKSIVLGPNTSGRPWPAVSAHCRMWGSRMCWQPSVSGRRRWARARRLAPARVSGRPPFGAGRARPRKWTTHSARAKNQMVVFNSHEPKTFDGKAPGSTWAARAAAGSGSGPVWARAHGPQLELEGFKQIRPQGSNNEVWRRAAQTSKPDGRPSGGRPTAAPKIEN